MGRILEQWRVGSAVIFAVVLVGGAYVVAHGIASPPSAEASEESQLLQAIASKDTDGDGLPDWAETLYGTDPNNSDTRGLGMTDKEAVQKGLIIPQAVANVPVATSSPSAPIISDLPPPPADNTLTAVFSKNLFTLYLSALQQKGGDLSDDDLADIANQALAQLGGSLSLAPDFKTLTNLTVAGSGSGAMKTYAANVEQVMLANKANATTSEIFYLRDAVVNGDATALARIISIAKLYRGAAAGIAALPVPTELANDDLALINAFAKLGEITNDFALVNSDPLTTMIALQQYPDAIGALGKAFIAIDTDFGNAGITMSDGEPGAAVVNLMRNIAAEQKAKTAQTP